MNDEIANAISAIDAVLLTDFIERRDLRPVILRWKRELDELDGITFDDDDE